MTSPGTAGDSATAAGPATLLCTDIVGSTRLAARLGDAAWRQRMEQHDRALQRCVAEHGGEVLAGTGDGALCRFAEPEAALACALALHARLAPLDLPLRAGLHLGGTAPSGPGADTDLVARLASRIAEHAGPGETLISDSLHRALRGSRFHFVPRGRRRLRGIPGRWPLVLAGADPAWQRQQQWRQRGWRVAALALAAGLLLGGGTLVQRVGMQGLAERTGLRQPAPAVAVLPFANLSSRPEDAYFAAGIQDEILTQLSTIGALRVIPRASTREYQSAPQNLRAVGRQLGVSHVLEGSVQRDGGAARIAVQLIRTADQNQVWAENYQRPMADLLGVQSEVARAVARTLGAPLSEAERRGLARPTTTQAEAYDAFLHGLAATTLSDGDEANTAAAIRHFEQAVALDPGYLQAWAQLSWARARLAPAGEHGAALAAAARQAAETARRLDPDALEAQLAEAGYFARVAADFPRARQLYEAIERRQPGRPEVVLALAGIAANQRRWPDAVRLYAQGLAQDPQNRSLFRDYGGLLLTLSRFQDAHRLLDQGLERFPDDAPLIALRASTYLAEGRLDAAEAALAAPGQDSPERSRFWARHRLLDLQRRHAEQVAALLPLLAPGGAGPGPERLALLNSLGQVQDQLGDPAAARLSYQAALREGLPLVAASPGGSPAGLALAWTYARLGQAVPARRQLAGNEEFFRRQGALHAGQYQETRAEVELLLGDHRAALDLLGRQAGQPSRLGIPLSPAILAREPRWDPLRADPEFQALLRPAQKP